MERSRLAELLGPFLAGTKPSPELLDQLQRYLELLLRWNSRVNLTAVRDSEQIVTRHFGESLFAAEVLAKHSAFERATTLADIGSGAGFPGIPIKLLTPSLALTLIESQNKKAVFLREAVRELALEEVTVFCGRAEEWNGTADIVTLRAVEQFARVLPVAARLVSGGGCLCLLIGETQLSQAQQLTPGAWTWAEPVAVPYSSSRIVALGKRTGLDAPEVPK